MYVTKHRVIMTSPRNCKEPFRKKRTESEAGSAQETVLQKPRGKEQGNSELHQILVRSRVNLHIILKKKLLFSVDELVILRWRHYFALRFIETMKKDVNILILYIQKPKFLIFLKCPPPTM